MVEKNLNENLWIVRPRRRRRRRRIILNRFGRVNINKIDMCAKTYLLFCIQAFTICLGAFNRFFWCFANWKV